MVDGLSLFVVVVSRKLNVLFTFICSRWRTRGEDNKLAEDHHERTIICIILILLQLCSFNSTQRILLTMGLRK